MKKILVTTDFSSESAEVFPMVRQLAEMSGAGTTVCLAYVVETPLLFETGEMGPSYVQSQMIL